MRATSSLLLIFFSEIVGQLQLIQYVYVLEIVTKVVMWFNWQTQSKYLNC